MKKTLSIMLIIMLALTSVFANGETETAAAAGSNEKTVIEVWTCDRHDLSYFEDKVAEFNATNDHIEIKVTVMTDNYSNMLLMAYTGGNAPDMFVGSSGMDGFELRTFVNGGMLLPYPDEVLDDPEFVRATDARNHMLPDVNVIDDKIYGVYNVMRASGRMIYNADLFEAAGYTEFPKTLDELVECADHLTKLGKGEYYGISTCASGQFGRWIERICEKSGIVRYDYENGVYKFDDYKPILEKCQMFFKNGSMFPGSNSQGVDAMRAQFANGTFVLWGNASQEAGVFTKQFPVEDFEWKVAEVPSLTGEVVGAVEAQPQKAFFVFSDTEHPEECWEVVKAFNTVDYVVGYCEEGFANAYTEEVAKLVDPEKIGAMAKFPPLPYEDKYPMPPVVTLAGDDYQKTLWNCILNGTDVDACIADLNKRYNDALDKDIKLGKIKRLVIKDFDVLHPNAHPFTYLDK